MHTTLGAVCKGSGVIAKPAWNGGDAADYGGLQGRYRGSRPSTPGLDATGTNPETAEDI